MAIVIYYEWDMQVDNDIMENEELKEYNWKGLNYVYYKMFCKRNYKESGALFVEIGDYYEKN